MTEEDEHCSGCPFVYSLRDNLMVIIPPTLNACDVNVLLSARWRQRRYCSSDCFRLFGWPTFRRLSWWLCIFIPPPWWL